jgi:hypothetical protein
VGAISRVGRRCRHMSRPSAGESTFPINHA